MKHQVASCLFNQLLHKSTHTCTLRHLRHELWLGILTRENKRPASGHNDLNFLSPSTRMSDFSLFCSHVSSSRQVIGSEITGSPVHLLLSAAATSVHLPAEPAVDSGSSDHGYLLTRGAADTESQVRQQLLTRCRVWG